MEMQDRREKKKKKFEVVRSRVSHIILEMTEEVKGEPNKAPRRRELSPAMHFWAGGFGGMVGALATGPLEMVKTRLQVCDSH